MRDRSIVAALTLLAAACLPLLGAQNSGPPDRAKTQKTPAASAQVPDLSGLWGPGGKTVNNWLPNDPRGLHPEQAPMTPWAEQRFKAARPPFGANQTFEGINDPVQKYCDPPGVSRIYLYPWEFTLVSQPDVVYILYEYTRTWRSIAMNKEHSKDPDSTWLGESVGRYEGDALVVDTVGFNDKTWLDHLGHPHSEALHLIERFRRVDHDTLELQVTVDDPKAYTKTFTGTKLFKLSNSPMSEGICSMSESEAFQKHVIDPTTQNAK
jgi:hypothetical protein